MTKHFDGLTNTESTNGSSRVQTPLRQRSNVDISETDNSNTGASQERFKHLLGEEMVLLPAQEESKAVAQNQGGLNRVRKMANRFNAAVEKSTESLAASPRTQAPIRQKPTADKNGADNLTEESAQSHEKDIAKESPSLSRPGEIQLQREGPVATDRQEGLNRGRTVREMASRFNTSAEKSTESLTPSSHSTRSTLRQSFNVDFSSSENGAEDFNASRERLKNILKKQALQLQNSVSGARTLSSRSLDDLKSSSE
jgi:hypothetical protein